MGHFDKTYGAELLKKPEYIVFLLIVTVACAWVTSKMGLIAGLGIVVLPIAVAFLTIIFLYPKVGLYAIFILNFTALGINRYIPAPWGLSIDGILILVYLSLFFMSFRKKIPWENAKSDVTLLAAIWYGYALFQLVNPEAVSRVAWFYAMRGVAFYMLLIIPLIFILFYKKKDLNVFLMIWAVFSILGTMKGIMQMMFGVDPFEQRWLDSGGAVTHILFGKLRVFSFYSDAGQFGASQGQTGVVFGILALNQKGNWKLKIFYGLTAVLGIYGMMISGTRGAIAVPVMGAALYVILRKNIKVMILGLIAGITFFGFFKYTTIGNGNYNIRRMRTAFDPNDASLLVRLENQRKLKAYMASRPFGGGIGSAGNWGQRFSPNTFLANTPTDSWYVAIWAEQGIVGLILHLFILLYIIIKSSFVVMFKIRDDWIKAQIAALACGMFGIMVASYGNGVLGQIPTGLLIYSSMAYLFLAQKLDEEALIEKERLKQNKNLIAL